MELWQEPDDGELRDPSGQPDRRDEWLMGQMAAGRRDLMGPLVRRHGSPLLSFIRRMVADPHRSEELFQEVFLAVWAKRDQYRAASPFKPWLYAIAVNKCREAFRAKGLGRVLRLPEDPDGMATAATGGAGPADVAIATETAALVEAAVATLPPKQREVILLRVWGGLPYAEIAQSLGVREATVRSNMHDALAAVRRYLEPRMR